MSANAILCLCNRTMYQRKWNSSRNPFGMYLESISELCFKSTFTNKTVHTSLKLLITELILTAFELIPKARTVYLRAKGNWEANKQFIRKHFPGIN